MNRNEKVKTETPKLVSYCALWTHGKLNDRTSTDILYVCTPPLTMLTKWMPFDMAPVVLQPDRLSHGGGVVYRIGLFGTRHVHAQQAFLNHASHLQNLQINSH